MTPDALRASLGEYPTQAKLRRSCRLVVECFMAGWGMNTIAGHLLVSRLAIEDAVRWYANKRSRS